MSGIISDFLLTLECVLTLSLFRSLSVFTYIKHTGCLDDWKTFRKHTILCLIKSHIEYKKCVWKNKLFKWSFINRNDNVPLKCCRLPNKIINAKGRKLPFELLVKCMQQTPKTMCPKTNIAFVALMKLKVSPYSWRYHTHQTQNMKESHSA